MIEIPKELGYYMPGEWEKHSAVWLAWPYGDITFPNILKDIEEKYCEIIKSLIESEKIKLLVLNEREKSRIENILVGFGIDINNIIFYIQDYADVWTRDYAPITLLNKNNNEKAFVKWQYNAYGKKEDPLFVDLLKDDKVFLNILGKDKIFDGGMVLEGGAIESNGKGTLLTTEQTLLNPNRTNLNKEEIESKIKDYLGIDNIIWLKEGLVNDHTDGHVDEVARFVKEDTVLVAYEDDEKDPNFSILNDNFKILENSRDQDGNKFKVIKLPMPHMNYDNGEKAPVSYTNFYIGNVIILMSIFNDPNDIKAMDILQGVFPDRKIIGVDCSKIIYGGGAIHCITMQEYLNK
jgi:agmatine deiminase